jgi:hypothetical protein
MADALNLLNLTIVDVASLDQMTDRVNVLINLFKAVGGIFIIGIIAWIISMKNMLKQQKLLKEINRKLDKLTKKKR